MGFFFVSDFRVFCVKGIGLAISNIGYTRIDHCTALMPLVPYTIWHLMALRAFHICVL